MIPAKFLQSRVTLNTDVQYSQKSIHRIQKYSSQIMLNIYRVKPLLKFPKNKTVRRQTQMNTLIESTKNPEKFCIKPFQKANKSTLNDIIQIKRISKSGVFNPLSKSLDLKHPEPRTFEDIGAVNNKKKTPYPLQYKPDPILTGESAKEVKKSSSTIWKNQRRLRDNGKVTKQSLTWKVNPQIKRQFYGLKTETKRESQGDFSKLLNYQRRK